MSKIKTLAEQLAEVAKIKKELSIKEEAIKGLLIAELDKEGKQNEVFDFGSVSVGHRRTYVYSEAIKKLEDKIKIKKDDEVKQGIAEEKITQFLTFREAKIK